MQKNKHSINDDNDHFRYTSVERNICVLFIVLVLAIVLNLAPFQKIAPRASLSGYPAIIELANSGIIGGNIILHRRGMYLALGQNAPNIDMLLPTDNALDIAQLYGFGRVRNIEYKNYDPETLFGNYDYSNHIVTSFKGDERLGPGPFVIAMDKNTEAMVLLRQNDTWHLVDISLLPMGNP